VGKGTLAGLLFHALGTCPLATGDVFRAARGHAVARGSALAAAQAQVEQGLPVTDKIMLQLNRERSHCLHCAGGFLLDGFPRTLAQAHAFDALLAAEGVPLNAVILLELSDSDLITRLAGRRVCGRCTAVYHLASHRPRVLGRCDECGSALEQRPEDQPESVSSQLDAYSARTERIAEHYRQRGLLMPVDASGNSVEILAHTLDGLAALGLPA
jgi:adenylate kinase